MADDVQTVFGMCRAMLFDDPAQPAYSDAYLMPLLNLALRALRDECMVGTEDTAAEYVTVIANFPQGTKDLSAYLKPGAQLANLIAPIEIWEKPAGYPDSSYSQVKATDRLPDWTPEDYLYRYEWRADCVYFNGAQQSLDLQVRYEGTWPTVTSVNDALPGPNLAHILAKWTYSEVPVIPPQAALAARADAKHLGYLWLNRQIKANQEKPLKQRPFRPKRGGWFGMGQGPFA